MSTLRDLRPSAEVLDAPTDTLSFKHQLSRFCQNSVSDPSPLVSKRPTVRDSRIDSLKILASTLIREIEALDDESDDKAAVELNLQTEVRRFEAELIRSALVRTGGRQRRAARLLGVKVTTLNTKIRRYGIQIGHSFVGSEDESGASSETIS